MKISIITLGCPKNVVDSEYLRGWLLGSNQQFTEQIHEADVVIINTCAFILPAREEAIESILEAVNLKNKGVVKRVYVTGCLPQRYLNELKTEIREVDRFFPQYDFNEIGKIVAQDLKIQTSGEIKKRFLETSSHYAYLKLSEGCDNHCHYCTIPQIKGRQRSKDPQELIDEAASLVDDGVKELILVAQDSTSYGRDLEKKDALVQLIRSLAEIEKLKWIRILYANPRHLNDSLIDLFRTEEKLCQYLDLPIQHISNKILKSMGRKISEVEQRRIIEKLKSHIPDIALRTTIMVGYPGETEKDFQLLKDYISEVKFDRLGVFKFIPEPGTKAARLPRQIDEAIKEDRLNELMSIQHDIALEKNKKLIGKRIKVIVDEANNSSQTFLGRTQWDSPLIDNAVHVRGNLKVGDFYNVTIDRGEAYDLWGKAK